MTDSPYAPSNNAGQIQQASTGMFGQNQFNQNEQKNQQNPLTNVNYSPSPQTGAPQSSPSSQSPSLNGTLLGSASAKPAVQPNQSGGEIFAPNDPRYQYQRDPSSVGGIWNPPQNMQLSQGPYQGQAQGSNINAPMGAFPGQAQGNMSAQDFIRNYQSSNSSSGGIGGLSTALQNAGYNTPRYMYGNTPSNNELMVDNQKYKVLGAEGTPGQYWYTGGDDSAPGQSQQNQQNQGMSPGMMQMIQQFLQQFNQGGNQNQMFGPQNPALQQPGSMNQQNDISSFLGGSPQMSFSGGNTDPRFSY